MLFLKSRVLYLLRVEKLHSAPLSVKNISIPTIQLFENNKCMNEVTKQLIDNMKGKLVKLSLCVCKVVISSCKKIMKEC